MPDENVKVAVRVRPFNSREKARNSKCCIEMDGPNTIIKDPAGEKEDKKFTFDHSYWSHDNFMEDENQMLQPTSDKYDGQQKVFDDVGQGVLKNAYDGFNTSLFAYGQTGAGKSFSMVGYGNNKGIVPLAFDALFKKIDGDPNKETKHQVTFSMLEIYMEAVADLLVKGSGPKGGLKVRQNPKLGKFFVQGLSKVPVSTYKEIDARMEEGTSNRTVAATQMNATSSRAHTVVTLEYQQIITGEDGKKTTRTSEINLVDLAGSERANSTGATGDRLKEGAQINKSLSALGNVISALAAGKTAPFRESKLTMLLKNALGGNSKTIMIAALSPADINYDETLGTLRYADRAKQIKNKAAVNESPTDKLIRELREENAKMKAMLGGAGGGVAMGDTSNMTEEEINKLRKKMEAEIRAQLANSEQQVNMADSEEYEKKLAAMKEEFEAKANKEDEKTIKLTTIPHLENMNEDPTLSGVVHYFLNEGMNRVGRRVKGAQGQAQPDVPLSGLTIQETHAQIEVGADGIKMTPGDVNCEVYVNGKKITEETKLEHMDRVLYGTNHLFLVKDPPRKKDDPESLAKYKEVDWDSAQSEIASGRGFEKTTGSSPGGITNELREQIMELLPMVSEANAISDRLSRQRSFEIMILSGPAAGLPPSEAKVMVKMINLQTGNRWMLSSNNFIDRRYMMQAMMRKAEQDGEEDDEDDEDEDDEADAPDPFYHSPSFVVVGCATCFLDSLSYNIEFDEKVNIVDYKGRNEGQIHVTVYPCDDADKTLSEDDVNEEPESQIGHPMNLRVEIKSIAGVRKTHRLKVCFNNPHDDSEVETAELKETSDFRWDFTSYIKVAKVDREFLEYLQNDSLSLFIKTWQDDDAVSSGMVRENTMMKKKSMGGRMGTAADIENLGGPGSQEIAEIKERAETSERALEDWKAKLLSLIGDYRDGNRDALSISQGIESIIDGTAIPAPTKEVSGVTVGELQAQLAAKDNEIRGLKRKATLNKIFTNRECRASAAQVRQSTAQLSQMDEQSREQIQELEEALAKAEEKNKKQEAPSDKKEQKSAACILL